jgi:hypothetical protein
MTTSVSSTTGTGGTSVSSTAGTGGTSVSSTAGTGGSGGQCTGTLDPQLVLPAPGGQPCDPPNDQCTLPAACDIDGPCSFVCVTCVACLQQGAACSKATDCDPGVLCYGGTCVPECEFTAPQPCIGGQCTHVGNSYYGVCLP